MANATPTLGLRREPPPVLTASLDVKLDPDALRWVVVLSDGRALFQTCRRDLAVQAVNAINAGARK